MNKEDILERSRKENRKKDAYELEVEYKAGTISAILMLVLAFIYFSYEIFTGKGSNPAFYSIITIYNSAFFTYKSIKLEKNRALSIVSAVIWSILSILLVLSYFKII